MELDFIAWLRQRLPPAPQIALAVGDDAALLEVSPGNACVVTTDMLMDGVDFRLTEHNPRDIGRKALAVNLSDLAAMGARPLAAFVAVALPHDQSATLARELLEGMLPLAEEFGCPIAGGDTNCWKQGLVISVTAIGETPVNRAWRRSGAQPGDVLVVSGDFGGSILGKHFHFTPRVREALWLQDSPIQVNAAIDVSDGLSLDLSRLCEASGCGAEVWPETIPIAAAAHELAARDGRAAFDHAWSDGEDFELILAIPAADWERLRHEPIIAGTKFTQIGQCIPEPGLWQRTAEGRAPVAPRGWVHGR
jgi:thiamine-monophosphate kinase